MVRALWLFLLGLAVPAVALAQVDAYETPPPGGFGWVVILVALALFLVIVFGGMATWRRKRREPRGRV